jgi:hypothetical protein
MNLAHSSAVMPGRQIRGLRVEPAMTDAAIPKWLSSRATTRDPCQSEALLVGRRGLRVEPAMTKAAIPKWLSSRATTRDPCQPEALLVGRHGLRVEPAMTDAAISIGPAMTKAAIPKWLSSRASKCWSSRATTPDPCQPEALLVGRHGLRVEPAMTSAAISIEPAMTKAAIPKWLSSRAAKCLSSRATTRDPCQPEALPVGRHGLRVEPAMTDAAIPIGAAMTTAVVKARSAMDH